jgi:hypothetical protein
MLEPQQVRKAAEEGGNYYDGEVREAGHQCATVVPCRASYCERYGGLTPSFPLRLQRLDQGRAQRSAVVAGEKPLAAVRLTGILNDATIEVTIRRQKTSLACVLYREVRPLLFIAALA